MIGKFSGRPVRGALTFACIAVALAAGAATYLDYEALDPSQVSYKISATTSGPANNFLPSTQQNVQLTIHGSKPGGSIVEQLRGPFASGQARNFPQVNNKNIGYPCSISLDTAGADGWLAESVVVEYFYKNQSVNKATFSQNKKGLGWIDGEGCGQQLGTNLAPLGTATQKSDYQGKWKASAAINGNAGGKGSRDFTHTAGGQGDWWQVRLKEHSLISKVVIWNRMDGYGERLTNFKLSVLSLRDENGDLRKDQTGKPIEKGRLVWSQDLFVKPGTYPNPNAEIYMPEGTKGDIVRIQLNGKNFLSLNEVEVFGIGESGSTGVCPKPARFFADETVEACDQLKRGSPAASAAAAKATLQTMVPSPNDQAQLVRINATGFVQNAARQLATITINFSVKDASQIWQPLSVDTSYVENGLSAEISKIVAVKSASEPLSFTNLTVPYGALQNAASQTLSRQRDPHQIRVEAVLDVGGVEVAKKQASFRITIR